MEMKVESGFRSARTLIFAESGCASLFVLAVGVASALASPILSSLPSKVTSEFSDAQLKLAVLNRAKIVFSNNGIEKLV